MQYINELLCLFQSTINDIGNDIEDEMMFVRKRDPLPGTYVLFQINIIKQPVCKFMQIITGLPKAHAMSKSYKKPKPPSLDKAPEVSPPADDCMSRDGNLCKRIQSQLLGLHQKFHQQQKTPFQDTEHMHKLLLVRFCQAMEFTGKRLQ